MSFFGSMGWLADAGSQRPGNAAIIDSWSMPSISQHRRGVPTCLSWDQGGSWLSDAVVSRLTHCMPPMTARLGSDLPQTMGLSLSRVGQPCRSWVLLQRARLSCLFPFSGHSRQHQGSLGFYVHLLRT